MRIKNSPVYSSKLYKTLLNASKHTSREGLLPLGIIAEEIGVTERAVAYWLKKGSIPVNRAKQIVKIKGMKLKFADLEPFTHDTQELRTKLRLAKNKKAKKTPK